MHMCSMASRVLFLLAAIAVADDLREMDESVTELAFGARGECAKLACHFVASMTLVAS